MTRKMSPAGRSFAVVCAQARRGTTLRRYVNALLLVGISGSVFSVLQDLLKPAQLITDSGLPPVTRAVNEYAVRQYAMSWNTGNEALARAALAGNFIDRTPPEGHRQGPEGAILVSRAFRRAVPDLCCDVEQMVVAGDRVTLHLCFRGHFTGAFGTQKGRGQNIDFIATDIYQISGGKTAANWHIEDNLTLMKQLGVQQVVHPSGE